MRIQSARIASLTILAALSGAAVGGVQSAAQTTPGQISSEPASTPAFITNFPDPAVGATITAIMPKFGGMGPVKGLPFSATETVVREQTLADGTVIKTRVEVLVWRDAEGRMRAEGTLKHQPGMAVQGKIVAVWNPVEGTEMSWVSGSENENFATVIHLPEMQVNSLLSAAPPPPQGAVSRPPRPLALPSNASQNTASLHTEALPPDNIAGLNVVGSRTTQVIPAGSMDNDREMTVVSETWTSPDLKIAMRQTMDDPRSGKIMTELSNVDQSEPDPALFKIPEGYKTMEMPLPTHAGTQR